MQKLCVFVVVTIVLAAAAPAQARSTCNPHGSKTVAADAKVRVFTLRKSGSDTTRLYACRLTSRKRYLLASAQEQGGTGTAVSLVRVVGRFVAWDAQPFDDSQRYNPDFQGFPSTVNELDTGSGQRTTVPATTGTPAASSVTALLVTGSGSLGWIGSAGTLEVHLYENAGDTLLDSGTDIDPTSLAAAAHQLYWMRAGLPRSAPLT
jgi:hypothetical protein